MADVPVAYQITAVTLIVMGNSKNSGAFNFAIILRSHKFDAREIYALYCNHFNKHFSAILYCKDSRDTA